MSGVCCVYFSVNYVMVTCGELQFSKSRKLLLSPKQQDKLQKEDSALDLHK